MKEQWAWIIWCGLRTSHVQNSPLHDEYYKIIKLSMILDISERNKLPKATKYKHDGLGIIKVNPSTKSKFSLTSEI